MTEPSRAARHAVAYPSAPPAPDGVTPDEVWVPPPYQPPQPGDFVEFASAGFEVKRSHAGLRIVLALLLVALLAAGGWWFFLRDRGGSELALPSCTAAQHEIEAGFGKHLKIVNGGHIPAGFPSPGSDPALVCTLVAGRESVVVGLWPHGSETDYSALLVAGGWGITSSMPDGVTVHVNGADHRRVATGTLDGMLVVAYQR